MSSAYRSATRRSADVDESLFGTGASRTGSRGNGGLSRNGTAIVSQQLVQQLSSPAHAKDTVLISDRELKNMMTLTAGRRGFAATQQPQQMGLTSASSFGGSMRATSAGSASKAQARKEKMARLEREAALRRNQPADGDFEEKEERQRMLGAAKQAMDEEMDDVKHMNQMMLYAQCVTIRDAQILEKQRIADQLLEEEKRMDRAMEAERVRTLKLQAEREIARAEEQRLGASVIITQIQEREQERIRQQEAREQEAQAMLARVQALEQAEEQERLAKVAAGRRLLAQVTEANNQQARAKLRKKQEEIDEELRIQAYIRAKEAREAANEAELNRIRAEKEKEHARLLAMQERAQDRQSAIDELRAKRYQEAKDREWRQGQLEQAGRRDAMKRDIAQARDAQRAEKARRIAEQALQERDEYMRVLEWQNAQTEHDGARQHAAALATTQHRDALRSQMDAKAREKEAARLRYLGEGQIFAQQNERDKAKLLAIKAEKLALMEQMGVPEKYRTEMAKKKMLVAKIF